MKQLTGYRGAVYDSPETKEDAADKEYRGWVITWVRPPIPAGSGCEWAAYDPNDEEWGTMHANTVDELKSLIDGELEERAEA